MMTKRNIATSPCGPCQFQHYTVPEIFPPARAAELYKTELEE